MFLAYGAYTHDQNEAEITITREQLVNAEGFGYGYLERWTIRGRKFAATQSALTTAIDALEAAYASNGGNLALYLDDGVTLTAHYLLSASTVSGTKVVRGPSFPIGVGAEYSTFRSYEIEVEGEVHTATNSQAVLLQWNEALTFEGGLQLDIHLQPLIGLPIKQTPFQNTPYRARQEGSALGRLDWPVPPAPIWPGDEIRPSRSIRYESPERFDQGNGIVFFRNYPVSWSYTFESATALTGSPTLWP